MATRTVSNETLIREVLDLEVEAVRLATEIKARKALLVKQIGVGQSVETERALVTIVQNTTVTLDLDELRAVRPGWATKLSKRVLDQAKLTLLRKAAQLPSDVEALLVETPQAPYVKITPRDNPQS